MIMGDEHTFGLWWYGMDGRLVTIETTPLNWGSMEMGLQREFLGIKREVTNTLEFDSTASLAITNARNGNYPIYLTLNRRNNDLTYSVVRTWAGAMETYKKKRSQVAIGFKSSTAREEIEKNKSTKYDIPLGASRLIYSGIDNDATNIVSGVVRRVEDENTAYHFSPSNWILQGNHSSVEASTLTFDNYKITIAQAGTFTIRVKLGRLVIRNNDTWTNTTHVLLTHYNGSNVTGTVKAHLRQFDQNDVYIDFDTSLADSAFEYNAYETFTVTAAAGDTIVLMYSTPRRPTYIYQMLCADLRLEIQSQEHSIYTDYPVQSDTIPTLITALLAKMCVVPPTLAYNLTENANYLPVLTSAQGLSQTPNPIITVSFEDIMKCLFMLYGADYEVIDGAGDDLTLDIRPMGDLMSDTQAEVYEAVNGIEVTYSDEHVYGTVKVGYETDENAKNGQYDPMCINTFKLGDSDNELDLVCPFKASPTTIEQFIRDKKTSSSTTKDSDTSVFLFCVSSFLDGEGVLYRGHIVRQTPTPYLVNSKFFNLPYSPMRILTNVAKYLKVSRWNIDGMMPFVSTERTATLKTDLMPFSSVVVDETLGSTDLTTAMQYPLFLPDVVDFESLTDLWNKTKINGYPRKYITVTDEFTQETHNVYINDISLPLTKRKSITVSGLKKYDIPQ